MPDPTPPARLTCETCAHFTTMWDGPRAWGECRESPPVVVPTGDPADPREVCYPHMDPRTPACGHYLTPAEWRDYRAGLLASLREYLPRSTDPEIAP